MKGQNTKNQLLFKLQTCAFLMCLFMAVGSIKAATVYVDLNASGNNDGSSWSNAFIRLYDAVATANPGDELLVAQGTYGEGFEVLITIPLSIKGGYPTGGGDQDIDANPTILSGANVNRVVKATHSTGTLYFEGLTIQDGFAHTADGAGINSIGDLNLSFVTVQNNSAFSSITFHHDTKGAGIYSTANITLTNSQVSHNSASSLTESSSSFTSGAGIYGTANITLTNSQVNYNVAGASASGVFSFSSFASGAGIYGTTNITLINSQVSNNSASSRAFSYSAVTSGSGIYGGAGSSIELINSQVSHNTTLATTTDSSIAWGSSSSGGGIYGEAGSTIVLTNSQVIYNTSSCNTTTSSSSAKGGGIYGSNIAITNSQVSRNTASTISKSLDPLAGSNSQGGGIYGGNTAIVQNSVLWGNREYEEIAGKLQVDGFNEHEGGALTTSYSLIRGEDLSASNGIDATVLDFDPMFADEANDDFRLLAGSPLIDAGDFNLLPLDAYDIDGDGNLTERIPLDLDGMSREFGVNVDIGPYEFPQDFYFVGGIVTGLLSGNTMTLQNTPNDDLLIEQNGAFVFGLPMFVDDEYEISILLHPDDPIQPCLLSNNTGIITNHDIIDVVVTCEIGDDLIFRDGFD